MNSDMSIKTFDDEIKRAIIGLLFKKYSEAFYITVDEDGLVRCWASEKDKPYLYRLDSRYKRWKSEDPQSGSDYLNEISFLVGHFDVKDYIFCRDDYVMNEKMKREFVDLLIKSI